MLMPFANVDVNSPEYRFGYMLGLFTATVIIGLWPLLAGIRNRRPFLGITGFVACIAGGLLLACFGSVPIAIFFAALIGAMGPPEPPAQDPFRDAPFDPYSNGKRSTF